ncbi:MAG: peptidase domain-containing ABC transporter [Bacilli bacterium]|nr:peptidase domain-containing ABC transporter [Bacilli bacterium]
MKKILVLQDGVKECGAACLLSIIRYYGGNVSLERLLELTKTDKEGTNFYNLQEAANEIGLVSKGYKLDDINKLIDLEKPFISQIVINNYTHFVVVYKIKNNKVTIMDPAKGMLKLNLDEFNNIWTGYILILEPYKKLPIYNENNYIISILKEVLLNNKKIIINLFSLTLIVTLFTCIYSYYFKVIIDNIINTDKLNLLIITIIFLIIFSLKVFIEYLRNNLLLYLNQKLDLSIITKTTDKIISLPYSYYKNKTTGEMISRINDLFYIKNVISKIIVTIFLDIMLSLVTMIILFNINKSMSLYLIIITIIYLLVFLIFKPIIKNMTNIAQEDNSKINSLLVESISSYETIKGLNLEKNFQNKINKLYLNSINNNLNFTKLNNIEELFKDLFEGIILLFIIYLGGSLIMDKSITIGSLVTFNSLVYYFLTPIRNSFEFYKEFYYVKNSIKRINNILNYKYEKLDKSTNLNIEGNIVIKNLDFSYNNKIKTIDNISLEINNKDKILMLGPSGSGKSTLLKILYKYYDIKRDRVYLNNYDINDYSLKDIRENITYISQNELLYNDTIRNNIILNRNVTEEEFIRVCNMVYVTDIVKDNILSYNYQLEENGTNLSGGQRQRIILARSLLKKSKIILIDEGLNEIDINLERKILKNIFSYYKDKTIIIISHRLDNTDLYNKVLNIESGKIKEVISKNE